MQTPTPLVWDYHRNLGSSVDVGGVVHYHDEQAQSLYLKSNKLTTEHGQIPEGHWRENIPNYIKNVKISNDTTNVIRLDHAYNGDLFGVAQEGNKLMFYRYRYGFDISGLTENWSIPHTMDSPVAQFNASLYNIGAFEFAHEGTLFQPGSRITADVRAGESEYLRLGTYLLDETDYDILADTISISGRNYSGFYLKDQTLNRNIKYLKDVNDKPNVHSRRIDLKVIHLDDEIRFTGEAWKYSSKDESNGEFTNKLGTIIQIKAYAECPLHLDGIGWVHMSDVTEHISHLPDPIKPMVIQDYTVKEIAEHIISLADPDLGQYRFVVQNLTNKVEMEIEPSTTFLEALEKLCDVASNSVSNPVRIAETHNGIIALGKEDWLKSFSKRDVFDLDIDDTIFKRHTTKMADGAFTGILVSGMGRYDESLKPEYRDINYFNYWNLGEHKTKHITAPDGFTQTQLAAWANDQAKKHQYVGVKEDFSGRFRPQLVAGDIVQIHEDGKDVNIGLVTDLTHTFSASDGFTTDFSVDSGGVETSGDDYDVIYTRAANVDGANRRQNLADLIRLISKG